MSFNSNLGWFWFGNDRFLMKLLLHSPWSFFLVKVTASCQNKLQTGGFAPLKIQVQFHALGYLRRRINPITFTYCSPCPKFQRTGGILRMMWITEGCKSHPSSWPGRRTSWRSHHHPSSSKNTSTTSSLLSSTWVQPWHHTEITPGRLRESR